ncbi:MAG: hypothetical protein LBC53_05510 [Spirochaetaceae bacterium]|nr:hypothetical protein [Spirochaetaceae bacterium]
MNSVLADGAVPKKLVLLLPWTSYLDVHLKKDTGLFPVYFAKEYNIKTEIVFFDGGHPLTTKETSHRGVAIKKLPLPQGIDGVPRLRNPVKFLRFLLAVCKYIKQESRSISHIMLFHATYYSMFLCVYIKTWFPHIKTYVKMDAGFEGAAGAVNNKFSAGSIMLRIVLANASLVTCESKKAAELFKTTRAFSKIQYAPNGIADEL